MSTGAIGIQPMKVPTIKSNKIRKPGAIKKPKSPTVPKIMKSPLQMKRDMVAKLATMRLGNASK